VNSSPVIRVAQLSDTHFLENGEAAEGTFAYDTAEAFEAVAADLAEQEPFDLITVTGDVADHGRAGQYQRAATAFARLDSPVNVCPGNHDQDALFTASMARPTVAISRAMELGPWCFLFVDSNAGVLIETDDGRRVDPKEYEDRLHRNGALGDREANWVRDMCAATSAEHVFVWLHHPPDPPMGLTNDADYAAEWRALIADLPNVRGFAGGHTHVPDEYDFEGRPVFVSPAFKNNFDMENETTLPPGYRTYKFFADGTVSSEVHLMEDPRWPRHPLGRAVMALLRGELTFDEFSEIVARKAPSPQ